jgi:hypothetical protein
MEQGMMPRLCWSGTHAAMLGLCVLLGGGCTTLPVTKPDLAALLSREPEPTQMVVTVQPSVLQEAGIPKYTGMMCRAYFFAGKDPVPVKVSGDWTCVAFESPEGTAENPQGLYRVPAKDMESHYRKDVVGHSYVFWYPYETNRPAQLQLQGRLKLSEGREIQSSWIKLKMEPAGGMAAEGEKKTAPAEKSEGEASPPKNSTDADTKE